MTELNLDATNTIIGRLASYVAKQALLGNTVNIFNAEKAIMSGSMDYNYDRYWKLIRDIGQPRKGPFIPRLSDRFVKRLIRGMLPHKRQRGVDAYKRIMCYRGLPDVFKDKKITRYEPADKSRLHHVKYVTIKDLCVKLGGKA